MAQRMVIALYPDMEKAAAAERALAAGGRTLHRLRVVPHDGHHPESEHLCAELDLWRDDAQPKLGTHILIAEVGADDLSWAEEVCARYAPKKLEKRLPPGRRKPDGPPQPPA